MANKLKPENKIAQLEKKLQEGRSILTAIQFMDLAESFPVKLKEEIVRYLKTFE